jgi:lycopene cyclase-like protein
VSIAGGGAIGGSVDVVVVGSGPAALCIAASLADVGLPPLLIAPDDPRRPWANTYGIWGPEVDDLGLSSLLAHRWQDTVSWFDTSPTQHRVDYGLFDREALQDHWLDSFHGCSGQWLQHRVEGIRHGEEGSWLRTASGEEVQARIVIDASGHAPCCVRRPDDGPVAGQAAYGVVGRWDQPPVAEGRFVLMDYRSDHLSVEERMGPPTFLYAMDLGEERFFLEETSLALNPPLSFEELRRRLHRRLAHMGVKSTAVEHEEFCLFPMNPALPDLNQRVLAFGGAASMVHPASGYLMGGLLRRAPTLAANLAQGLEAGADPRLLAAEAWQVIWPRERRRRHALYRFGLEKLMRFSEARLRHFFATFFGLPQEQWFGFLTDTLPLPSLIASMLHLFARAPGDVRQGLIIPEGRELKLLSQLLNPPGP